MGLKDSGFSGEYDVELDPTTLNEFATIFPVVAFSFLGSQRRKALSERFNNPDELYDVDGMEKVFNHMINDPAEKPGLKLSVDFRGKFLKSKFSKIGFDLAALSLKKGRDHGIPGYIQIRRQCGLPRIYTFNDLAKEFANETIATKMSEVYDSIDDIDLLVGALSERPRKGSFIGPTLTCILGNQFAKTKNGDRFWYENFFAQSSFTDEQLIQVRKTSMARLICDLTKPEKVQLNSFLLPDNYDNNPVDCQSSVFPPMDMSAWKDLDNNLKLPITQETLQKVLKIAELNLQDQSRREISNIQKSNFDGFEMFFYKIYFQIKTYSKRETHFSPTRI